MPVPTLITDLSTTPASNSPSGSENVFPNLDDYLRFTSAALASIRDNSGNGWVSPYLSTSWPASPAALGTTTPNAATFTTLNAATPTFTGTVTLTNVHGSSVSGFRNRVINGGFSVNQRGVSGTVTLSAGAYGHDRWKAGASGCTYTFATSNNVTTLTISAGSLQQVVEGLNLESGTYCMSWTGTATGKIGAGSLSASGVTQAVTGGTNTTIEFSTGTLSLVQLEIGAATVHEQRGYGLELALCQRYYFRFTPAAAAERHGLGQATSGTVATIYLPFPVQMRTAPTALEQSGTATDYSLLVAGSTTACSAVPSFTAVGPYSAGLSFTVASGMTAGHCVIARAATTAGYLGFSAEL